MSYRVLDLAEMTPWDSISTIPDPALGYYFSALKPKPANGFLGSQQRLNPSCCGLCHTDTKGAFFFSHPRIQDLT